MPDLPQGGPAPAPQGAPPSDGAAPPPAGGGGGGIADALVQLDSLMSKIAQAVAQNNQLGDKVKSAWQAALAAEREAITAITDAAGGEGDGKPEPDEDDAGGATTPEQGGNKGAVPMSHQARGG